MSHREFSITNARLRLWGTSHFLQGQPPQFWATLSTRVRIGGLLFYNWEEYGKSNHECYAVTIRLYSLRIWWGSAQQLRRNIYANRGGVSRFQVDQLCYLHEGKQEILPQHTRGVGHLSVVLQACSTWDFYLRTQFPSSVEFFTFAGKYFGAVTFK